MKKQIVIVNANVYDMKRNLENKMANGWFVTHIVDGLAILEKEVENDPKTA